MKAVQLAYLAGLIDGEGSVLLSRLHRNCNRAPVISVTNTSKPILDWLCATYPGGVVVKHKKYQKNHHRAWDWKVSNQRAILLCRLLNPVLIHPIKKHRVTLIAEEYEAVTRRNGRYTTQQKLVKRQFERRFFHPAASRKREITA